MIILAVLCFWKFYKAVMKANKFKESYHRSGESSYIDKNNKNDPKEIPIIQMSLDNIAEIWLLITTLATALPLIYIFVNEPR